MNDQLEMDRRRAVVVGLLHEYKAGHISEDKAAESLERLEWPKWCVCDVCQKPFEPVAKRVRITRYLCENHSGESV